MHLKRVLVITSAIFSLAQSGPALKPDTPKQCDDCDAWNRPVEPFRLFGNTYYVGVEGLSSLLITSDAGHILLDGGLPQSAQRIDASIRKLGFRTADIRLILNSHAHFDHAGGINALQRATGAEVAVSAAGAAALRAGGPTPDDPQYDFGRGSQAFPPVSSVRVVKDGEVLRVGSLAVTAHFTPGHTPGAMTWTWQACEEARCLNVVYADSLTAVSAPGFRFTGDSTHPSSVETFRRSIDRVASLTCDIIISTHPGATSVLDKLARRRSQPDEDPFINSDACRNYAATVRKALEKRIAEEGAAVKGSRRSSSVPRLNLLTAPPAED